LVIFAAGSDPDLLCQQTALTEVSCQLRGSHNLPNAQQAKGGGKKLWVLPNKLEDTLPEAATVVPNRLPIHKSVVLGMQVKGEE